MKKLDRIGETRTMNGGMSATIIAYRNSLSIDVRFEDGYEVKDKAYGNFIRGKLANPNIRISQQRGISHIGESRRMNCGMSATITGYQSCSDITVMFDDGTEIKHKHYSNFKRGGIAHPNINTKQHLRQNHIGETLMMNCGMFATIIAYRKATDIDIRFTDGYEVTHKQYNNFLLGKIKHPR